MRAIRLTRKVPHPYTRPVLVTAMVTLSPAATRVKTVPSGMFSRETGPGTDSRGFIPLSISSSDSSSPSTARNWSACFVDRPRAPWSLTPQVRMTPSWVKATTCIPPVATWTTPTLSGKRFGLRRGRLTSVTRFACSCMCPSPSSPFAPSPNTYTFRRLVGAALTTLGAGPFLPFGFATGFFGGSPPFLSPPLAVAVLRAFLAGAAASAAEGSALRFFDEAEVVLAVAAARFLTGPALAREALCFLEGASATLVVALRFLEVLAAGAEAEESSK